MKWFFCTIDAVSRPLVFFLGSAALALLLFILEKRSEALLFAVSFAATFGIVGALKIITRIPRPAHPMVATLGYAFPSGHAAAGTFLAVILSNFSMKIFSHNAALAVGIALGVAAIGVSISRVYLRAHTPLQVFSGMAIGALVPAFIFLNYGTFF